MLGSDDSSLSGKILSAIRSAPGLTGGEIAKGIYGAAGIQPQVNSYLHKLMTEGSIWRKDGNRGYQYYLTEQSEKSMPGPTSREASRPVWFVGAMWGGRNDQMPRFIEEGIWENGYDKEYFTDVLAMEPGDRIAIKAAYVRKHNLPFKSNGEMVSVMSIKATGIIRENMNDGKKVLVDWNPRGDPREWYYYTGRGTVWRIIPGGWRQDALIAFAFDRVPQDVERFKKAPDNQFPWIPFYKDFARKLLLHRSRREELVAIAYRAAEQVGGLGYLKDTYPDGTVGPLRDICPFTLIGMFNRGITDDRRTKLANIIGKELGVTEDAPQIFPGIPVLNNLKSMFFHFANERKPEDIDHLWEVFEKSIGWSDGDFEEASELIKAFNQAMAVKGVSWNLTMGLFWSSPYSFPSLDELSRNFITQAFGETIDKSNAGVIGGEAYIALSNRLLDRFDDPESRAKSFPDITLKAWQAAQTSADSSELKRETHFEELVPELEPYTVDSLMSDGCFLDPNVIHQILDRLRAKQNLILQGPPGTGKTWLAKRLAYALLGFKDSGRILPLQFHPNLSYEDFVRGWRPDEGGRLTLIDGPFLELCLRARSEPDNNFVVVIEEINRGNPAQIFGELLTLLESDKRRAEEALQLCYRRDEAEKFYVPPNVFVIGTMNIADRSLALVDLAFRRRFAFVNLEPEIGGRWSTWMRTNHPGQEAIINQIQARMLLLNDDIANDSQLGPQFRIGHSYVTVGSNPGPSNLTGWFNSTIESEIVPLLDEYWYDQPERTKDQAAKLRLS